VLVGLGGLGVPAAAVLAEGGARSLRLIDGDRVELSNLPRQPLYTRADIGRPKVEVAAERLLARFPDARVTTHPERLEHDSVARLLADAAVILDGTDSFASKLLLNQAAIRLGVPLVHAGVLGMDGQLFTILPGETACLRCLFAEVPPDDELPSCQQAGVLGAVVAAVGMAAAREAAAVLGGVRPPLAGRLAILEGTRLRWRVVELSRRRGCAVCQGGGR
jgi:adenylyltransferase/sulfurtransferase